MKLLVIGSGGREHALAWCLAKTPGLQKVFVAPGNAGTAADRALENVAITDLDALADFAEEQKVSLTIVGPEAPLAAGIVNLFRARGLKIFGPSKEAAQLESSKDFAKRFMARHGIPTARFASFSERAPAHAYVDQQGAPIVIKADGLAAGKGVVVAMTLDEAHAALDRMLPAESTARTERQHAGAGGHRRVPGRRRSQLYRHGRRQGRTATGIEPGPQAYRRRR
jgi:phosphoribosylamine--glycine ligase